MQSLGRIDAGIGASIAAAVFLGHIPTKGGKCCEEKGVPLYRTNCWNVVLCHPLTSLRSSSWVLVVWSVGWRI